MLYKIAGSGNDFITQIKTIGFNNYAINVFHNQYNENQVYKSFSDALKVDIPHISSLANIPFIPISFFRTHKIITGVKKEPELVFVSSGTTGSDNSKHYVIDEQIYHQSLLHGFNQFYGNPAQYAILALLPSYLERENASLVHMAKLLMSESKHPLNGFYLDNFKQLFETIQTLESQGQKTLLLGVTFALLDFSEQYPMPLQHTIVMETGGMKGRKEELTRNEVHHLLKKQWQLENIHSEYGMTELLSQAYSKGDGVFYSSDTMKVLVRDINDPLEVKETGTGCLNIVDLANIYSCSFIATDDIGTVYTDGSFEVSGRLDHSALRGCNLMVL